MILAIDTGNTNIVLGCIKNGKILFTERMETDLRRTELEYAIAFRNVMELHGITPSQLDGGIISSVVPPLINVLRQALAKLADIEMMVVSHELETGLTLQMDNPAAVGSDLIVDAAAALELYGSPVTVIDMGTATTLSVVDKSGAYVSTIIMPGARISLDSLVSGTAQLPKIGLSVPPSVIGKNTVDCMRSGVLYGSAAMLDGMLDRIFEELCYETKIVATGGLAHAVIPHCRHNIILNDELLLQGLLLIYEKNRRERT